MKDNESKMNLKMEKRKEENQSRMKMDLIGWLMISASFLFFSASCFNSLIENRTKVIVYAVIGVSLLVLGIKKTLNRKNLIDKYNALVSRTGNTSILELANEVNVKANKVEVDLQKMIDAGFFGECYIDHKRNLLVMTNNGQPLEETRDAKVFECPFCGSLLQSGSQYCHVCGKRADGSSEELDPTTAEKDDEQVLKIAKEKDQYLERLEKCAQKATSTDLHDKILLLRGISENVFLRISSRPEYLTNVKKYENIYLPKLENAIDICIAMEAGGASEENVRKSKENALQVVNIGVRSSQKLLDSMYEGDQLDVETDLDVLKQMFL